MRKERFAVEKLKADNELPKAEEKQKLEAIYQADYERFDKYYIDMLLKINMNMDNLAKFIMLFDSYLCKTEDS